MQEIWQQIGGWLALYGLKSLGALIILALGLIAARSLTRLVRRLLVRAQADPTLVSFGGNVLHFILVVVVVMAALDRVGFDTTSLIAVLGAASLAVGLALQANLSNLAAGVLILIFRPFRVGDTVEAGGVTGSVNEVSILHTMIKTFDGQMVVMPNAKLTGDKLVNFSAIPTRRVDLVGGVGYGDDIAKAKAVIGALMAADPRILAEPAPRVDVLNLGESSVDLAVRPWVVNADFWNVRCELLERIKAALDAEGISIPFPQRDVHLVRDLAA
ncbi:MAG: mechanosensitive ion channel domain-containing protein [Pseudomonadota bacterium]